MPGLPVASTDHTQGAGFHPFRAARGGLSALLQGLQQGSADNRWVRYVAPLGPRVALVKNEGNDQVYQVGNATGKTFAPGTVVLVGSNAGQSNEVLLSGPPPGLTGGAAFPPQILQGGSTKGMALGKCPAPISGRTYLALFLGDYAALYQDSHFIRAFSPRNSLPVGPDPLQSATWQWFQWVTGDRVIFATDALADGKIRIHTWDAGSGTDSAAEIATSPTTISYSSAPLSVGGLNYFLGGRGDHAFDDMAVDWGTGDRKFKHFQLYSLPVGASGPSTPSTVGPIYSPSSAPGPVIGPWFGSICCPSPGIFEFPSAPESGVLAIASLASGVYSDGLARVPLTEDGYSFNSTAQPWVSNGYAVAGGSLRVAGIVPPGQSEIRRAPLAWNTIWGDPDSGQLSRVITSVSPSGLEYSVYPVFDRVDPASGFGQQPPGLLRLKAAPYPESKCPMPIVQVGPDPDGRYPDIMLARDF